MRLILLICSCACFAFSCNKQSNWSHQKIHSHDANFSYGKVVYYAPDPVHGLDFEIVCYPHELKVFLIVHSTPVAPCLDCPKKINLFIQIDDERIDCQADRFQGGQRFLLPEPSSARILSALKDQKDVYIQIPGYCSLIQAQGFSNHFQKIERAFMENPWRLPF